MLNPNKTGLLSGGLNTFKKGISFVESSNGVNLFNPYSSASGMFQILYSDVKDNHAKDLTRDEFAHNFELQNEIMSKRFNGKGGFSDPNEINIVSYVQKLKKEYEAPIKDTGYTDLDLAALTWYLGKQGTRKYLGYVIRDGKPLVEVFPHLFDKDAKAINKTPDEYIGAFRKGINN